MTEFNKSTTIGLSLIESLNEMVKEGTLTEQAASAIQVQLYLSPYRVIWCLFSLCVSFIFLG